jgi:hypothetical protein
MGGEPVRWGRRKLDVRDDCNPYIHIFGMDSELARREEGKVPLRRAMLFRANSKWGRGNMEA